ncbi:Stage II sporulation protein E (SpoIIE) [Actinoplanes derwentensis]|uniref:Stage II sporulation protein E (SpoIIE) n=2 Tax=Actinoplanes derwentensis TaxID=113562 RepID=A0A1H1VWY3_9ACTN|nr:Stage II sporulation protein E (SpoIIE) [Actinoplanes derwentensis]
MWTSVGRIGARDDLAELILPPLQALPGVVAVWGLRHDPAGDGVLEYRWTGVPLEGDFRDLARRWGAEPETVIPDGLYGLGVTTVLRARFDLAGEAAGTIMVLAGDSADLDLVGTCLGQVIEVTREAIRLLVVRRSERAQQTRDALLAEASLQMDAVLDTKQTMQRVPRMAVPAIAEGCLVFVTEDGKPVLRSSVHVDMRRLNGLLADPAARDHLAHLVGQAIQGAEVPAPDAALLATRTADVQVLRARGEVVGALVFLFDREDAAVPPPSFLRDLASRAALAIDNGTRYERRRRDVVTMQQHLLPTRLPDVDGLSVAAVYLVGDRILEVGGDFYDMVVCDDGSVAALIGDVCGRGVDAAALTGMARHTLAALLQEGASPARAISRLNARLRLDGSWRFVTAGVARLEQRGDGVTVQWTSAGHPAPVLVRRGGRIERATGGGTALGIVADPRIGCSEIHLAPGDTMIIFTDGLSESRDPDGTMFEDRALGETLERLRDRPIDVLVHELSRAAAAFDGAGTDDIAILGIHVEGNTDEPSGR